MPIYEYECGKCGHEFEREQRMSDPPVKSCPECRSRKVQKLISRSSFVLKGGGWYSDGYADAKPGSGKSDARDSTPSSGKTESSSSSSDKPKKSEKSDKGGKGGTSSGKSAASPTKSASKSAA